MYSNAVEIFGLVTGVLCVWLIVRENIWNWPIGLANNILLFIVFFQGRLYADMSLQVVYFALAVYGWRQWLRGGPNRTSLTVTRTAKWEWTAAAVVLILGTASMREILVRAGGAAPFWDALTTALSLVAQYLLCRKRLENWYFWIAADLVYVPLYLTRGLPYMAALYAVFLGLCVQGVIAWRRSMAAQSFATETA